LINETPREKFEKIKPDISNFKIFGTKCFVKMPDQLRRKLDNKAAEMVFIGYDSNSKAYRCYDPINKKLKISRDVVFQKSMLDDDHGNKIQEKIQQTELPGENKFIYEFKTKSKKLFKENQHSAHDNQHSKDDDSTDHDDFSDCQDNTQQCVDTDIDVSYEESSPELY
jgi:hypothetical protein